MTKAIDVLRRASKEVGYLQANDPLPGSKFGRWYEEFIDRDKTNYDFTNSQWCAEFVSFIFNDVGMNTIAFPSASCMVARNAARRNGMLLKSKYYAKPGDVVFFDWDPQNGNDVDHVGFVEKVYPTYIQTIEGNTSPNSNGSQSNGRGVHRRTRSFDVISSVMRPRYSGSIVVPNNDLVVVDGWVGYNSTKNIQLQLGTEPDGVFSGQYVGNRKFMHNLNSVQYDPKISGSQGIEAWQNLIGTEPDAIFGYTSVKYHQRWLRKQGFLKHAIDGYFGPDTAANTQHAINKGMFKNH